MEIRGGKHTLKQLSRAQPEDEMTKNEFIHRLQGRVASLAIGASTFRGTSDIVKPTRHALAEIDLSALAVANAASFSELLHELTRTLQARVSPFSKDLSWGRARKALNIFLRDVVYNVDLSNYYNLSRIRPWLEIPLDSNVAKALRADQKGKDLDPWHTVRDLDSAMSNRYQAVASEIAKDSNICRVDLDVLYFRGEMKREQG